MTNDMEDGATNQNSVQQLPNLATEDDHGKPNLGTEINENVKDDLKEEFGTKETERNIILKDLSK